MWFFLTALLCYVKVNRTFCYFDLHAEKLIHYHFYAHPIPFYSSFSIYCVIHLESVSCNYHFPAVGIMIVSSFSSSPRVQLFSHRRKSYPAYTHINILAYRPYQSALMGWVFSHILDKGESF
jgi:hypothetical protein